jgi:hypothetical protein
LEANAAIAPEVTSDIQFIAANKGVRKLTKEIPIGRTFLALDFTENTHKCVKWAMPILDEMGDTVRSDK